MQNAQMNKYYSFRSDLQDLYKNDINANGDLACKVLEIRDKNRCINSMEVSIQDGRIILEFDSKTPEKKRKNITSQISKSISNFIYDNKDNIKDYDDFIDNIVKNGSSYCDIYTVGDEVTFGLF